MDIEKLTKHQIVLLTLLVSFVTSIATGIVTVSLMNQAPPEVSRTINQIVERTIQQVVTAPAQGAAVATEKTIVVKNDDLAAQSIAAVQKAIVRIIASSNPEVLVARGVIVDAKGSTLTDIGALLASGATQFEAILPSGEKVAVTLPKDAATTTSALMVSLAVGTSTGFAPAPLADPLKLQLGQSVIRIGGTGADTVGGGVIAALPGASQGATIEASVSSATPGSVLITLFGEVVGVMTNNSQSYGSYVYATLPPPKPVPAAAEPKKSS